jgi:hypothetical protein
MSVVTLIVGGHMKFEPVDPRQMKDFRAAHRGRVSYPIVQGFLETGYPMAKVDRTGIQQTLMTLTSCLNSYINRHDLPVKVMQRGGDLYLMRLDVDDEGNIDPNWKDKSPERQAIAAAANGNAPLIDDLEVERRFEEEVGQVTK